MKQAFNSTYTLFVTSCITTALLTLTFYSGFAQADPNFTGCTVETVEATRAEFEQEVAELVNQQRAEVNMSPLKLITTLSNAARYHAADMKQDDYFQHDSYDLNGTKLVMVCKWNERIEKYYAGATLGENIAFGYSNPTIVMNGWMNSPGHRSNILNEHYRTIGVGYFSRYWVQDFGTEGSVYPLIINGEARQTVSPMVKLYIYGTEWTEMRLRNDDAQWGEWQPFANQVDWTMTNISGTRTVSVELRNAATTAASSDSIELVVSAEPTLVPGTTPTATQTATPTNTPTTESTPTATGTAASTATPTPTIAANALIGKVTLQGRPQPPHMSWRVPLQIQFIDQNPPNHTYDFSATTDDRGQFAINNPPQGKFFITVRGEHTLRQVVNAIVTSGTQTITVGELYEGDVTADNHVDLYDFSAIAMYYAACAGQMSLPTRVDLDGDTCVDTDDLSLLQANFHRSGATLPDTALRISAASFDRVNAEIELVEIQTKKAGDKFVVNVRVEGQAPDIVNAGALYLNFDPTKLNALSITPLSQFPVSLASHIDNSQGQADFTVGHLGKGIATPFLLASILFETKSDIETTALSLSVTSDRRTDLAGGGISLLPAPQNSEVIFTGELGEPTQTVYLPVIQRQ